MIWRIACVAVLTGCIAQPWAVPLEKTPGEDEGVVQEYDRFDRTWITRSREIAMSWLPGGLSAQLVRLSDPRSTTMILRARSSTWQYLQCRSLRLLVDGLPAGDFEMDHDGNIGVLGRSVRVSEVLTTEMPEHLMARVLKANLVEGRICNTEFAFDGEALADIRGFWSVSMRIEPHEKPTASQPLAETPTAP